MDTIAVERAGGVVTITLNRPEIKNAMSAPMFEELLETFHEVAASAADRVVVITGAGDGFCSGADLTFLSGGFDGSHFLNAMRRVADVALALHRLPKPTIAKVNGVAAGAGCNLA